MFSVQHDFVMGMWGRGASCASNLGDLVPTLYSLPVSDVDLRIVAVAGDDSEAVVDLDDVAVASSRACERNDSISGSINWGSGVVGDVDTAVKSFAARERVHAIAEL